MSQRVFRVTFYSIVAIMLFIIIFAITEKWRMLVVSAPSVASVCEDGRAQSPIDLGDAEQVSLTPIRFDYRTVPMSIFNTGYTIQVNYAPGSSIVYNEKRYEVQQFHFHRPAEHTFDGGRFAMELHIVHENVASGNLAVVTVLLQEGNAASQAYNQLFDNLPTEVGEPEETALMINAADLLPSDTETFVTYEGSLTTPPCTEIVRWLVFVEPVTITSEQIAAFTEIYDNNARPLQAVNTRDIFTNQN